MFDVTIAGAIVAGLLSFLSPCILPMVPFYLSYLGGLSMGQVSGSDDLPLHVRRRAVLAAMLFSAGIITVFVALGAASSVAGQLLREWFDVLRWIAAAIIFAMGLHFLGVVRIGILYRQLRAEPGGSGQVTSLAGAYVIGLAFAFGWTPCVGPALAAILSIAAGSETAGRGAMLLFVYGLGMTLPFVVAAAFVGPFMRWMRGFRRHLPLVEKAMGGLLIVFGLLIATDKINVIAFWMLEYWPEFG